jgi:hypothetical protein
MPNTSALWALIVAEVTEPEGEIFCMTLLLTVPTQALPVLSIATP